MTLLKMGNKTILRFDLEKGDFLVEEPHLLPFPLRDQLTDSRQRKDFSAFAVNYNILMNYFSGRRLSVKRENAKAILNALDIPQGNDNNTIIKTMILCKALSVVDNYWLSNDESETWEQVNLRDNPLHETLSQIALTGISPLSITGEIRTPELTAAGLYAKTWRREDGKLYLYKASTPNGMESEIEAEVSNILDYTNMPHVHYDFLMEDDLRLCKCLNMCSEQQSIVPAVDVADWCRKLHKDFHALVRNLDSENYYKTMIIDYLVSNSDRHMANWGFFMDNDTGELTGLHLLFDHNCAFNTRMMKYPDGDKSGILPDYNMRFCAELGMKHCDFKLDPYIPEAIFLNEAHWKSFKERAKMLHIKLEDKQKAFVVADGEIKPMQDQPIPLIALKDDALKEFLSGTQVSNFDKRDIYASLSSYLNSPNNRRVCALFGLRRTGKKTLMLQSMLELPVEDIAYIQCQYGNDMGQLNSILCSEELKDKKYVFLDEVTKLDNFVNTASLLADRFAITGRKLVLSGTDSYALALAGRKELYDRMVFLPTTYIPFKEYNRLLHRDLDDYIRYGGTLTDGYTFYNADSEDIYFNSSIAKNIENSLAQAGRDGEFGSLREFYNRGEFVSFLQKIVELSNRSFLMRTVNRMFKSHDLGSLYDLLLKNPSTSNIDFSFLKSEKLREAFMEALAIKEPLLSVATEKEMAEARKYLEWADVIYQVPNSEDVIFIQPGLRYAQLEKEVEVLRDYKEIQDLPFAVHNVLFNKLESDIKGRMLEDIIYYQLAKDKEFSSDFSIKKYQATVETDKGLQDHEIDICLKGKKKNDSFWLEVKYSDEFSPEQAIHLLDEDLRQQYRAEAGSDVFGQIIVYRGKTENRAKGLLTVNATDFLLNPNQFIDRAKEWAQVS